MQEAVKLANAKLQKKTLELFPSSQESLTIKETLMRCKAQMLRLHKRKRGRSSKLPKALTFGNTRVQPGLLAKKARVEVDKPVSAKVVKKAKKQVKQVKQVRALTFG